MPTAGGCRYPQQQKHALRDVTQDVKRGRAGQRRWPAPFRQPRGGCGYLTLLLRHACREAGEPRPGRREEHGPDPEAGRPLAFVAGMPSAGTVSVLRTRPQIVQARAFLPPISAAGLVACRCRSRAGRCCFSRRRRTPAGGLSRRASGPARTKALPPAPRRLRKRGKRRQRARRERRRQKRKSFPRPLHKPPSGPFPQMLPQHRSGRASGRTPAGQEYIINIA